MKMKTTPNGRIGRMLSLDSGTGMSVPEILPVPEILCSVFSVQVS